MPFEIIESKNSRETEIILSDGSTVFMKVMSIGTFEWQNPCTFEYIIRLTTPKNILVTLKFYGNAEIFTECFTLLNKIFCKEELLNDQQSEIALLYTFANALANNINILAPTLESKENLNRDVEIIRQRVRKIILNGFDNWHSDAKQEKKDTVNPDYCFIIPLNILPQKPIILPLKPLV